MSQLERLVEHVQQTAVGLVLLRWGRTPSEDELDAFTASLGDPGKVPFDPEHPQLLSDALMAVARAAAVNLLVDVLLEAQQQGADPVAILQAVEAAQA